MKVLLKSTFSDHHVQFFFSSFLIYNSLELLSNSSQDPLHGVVRLAPSTDSERIGVQPFGEMMPFSCMRGRHSSGTSPNTKSWLGFCKTKNVNFLNIKSSNIWHFLFPSFPIPVFFSLFLLQVDLFWETAENINSNRHIGVTLRKWVPY